jgi:hypothetical protein
MKGTLKYYTILILSLIIAMGLKAQPDLDGIWIRTSCSGGIAQTYRNTEDSFLIAFKNNQYFEGESINALRKTGDFSLKNGKSIFNTNSQLLVVNDKAEVFVIHQSGDQLSLQHNVFDGKKCFYKKINSAVESGKNYFTQIDFTLDFDKEIVLKNIPKSKIKTDANWQSSLLGNNIMLSFFDAEYVAANNETLNIKSANPILVISKDVTIVTLPNGDYQLHFVVLVKDSLKKSMLVQVSYNDKAILASVKKFISYKKKYNNVSITTDKAARLLDGNALKQDCFQVALAVDSYSGDAKWKRCFYDFLNGHSCFGKNFTDENYFLTCPIQKSKALKFQMRFFINKLNAG